jgi:putative hemolysin
MKKTPSLLYFMIVLVLSACASSTKVDSPQTTSQIANPASQNCLQQGGQLSIEKDGGGGEFGVCIFEENRQCEEWAMMRGDCPVGGIKITGYATDAARYCAITGAEYQVTASSGTEHEQGTCTFKNGKTCDVWDYFNGTCSRTE